MSKQHVPNGGISITSFNNVSWDDDQDDWRDKAQRLRVRAWRQMKNEMKH